MAPRQRNAFGIQGFGVQSLRLSVWPVIWALGLLGGGVRGALKGTKRAGPLLGVHGFKFQLEVGNSAPIVPTCSCTALFHLKRL